MILEKEEMLNTSSSIFPQQFLSNAINPSGHPNTGLILYHTIPTFTDPKEDGFGKK